MARRAFWGVTVLAALAAASCGGSSTLTGPPLAIVRATAVRTQRANTSRLAVRAVLKNAPGLPGGTATITGAGSFDYGRRVGVLSVRTPDPTEGLLTVETRVVGDSTYQQLPPRVAAGLPARQQWLRIDLPDLKGQSAFDQPGVIGSDPTEVLDVLRGASGRVARQGTDTVRGSETTRYAATVDFDKAAQELPPDQRARLEAFNALVGVHNAPVVVWIDRQGRARRESMTLTLPRPPGVPASTEPPQLAMTLELFDFGVSVHVAAPPTDEVADLREVQRLQRAANATAGDLPAILVNQPPPGFEALPGSTGGAVVTLPQAVASAQGSPPAQVQAELTGDGFVRGFLRLWVNKSTSTVLTAVVYGFQSDAGATAYVQQSVARDRARPGFSTFSVPQLPGAVGVALSGGDRSAVGVAFTVANRSFEIIAVGARVGPDQVLAVASAQYRLARQP